MSVGSPVDDRELEEALAAEGLTVDHGNLIGGPFIPDGTVRICDEWGPSSPREGSLGSEFRDGTLTVEELSEVMA